MIFLDLHKAYDYLDRYRCLEILEEYGVGPWALCLLKIYWDCLSMVAHAEVYYDAPFKGHRGVTHGVTLSPTLFNLVLNTVVQHCLSLVVEE